MPALQLAVAGVVAIDSAAGAIECPATAANYAERVAVELALSKLLERLARHSLVFGINGEAQRPRSRGLSALGAGTDRRSSGQTGP